MITMKFATRLGLITTLAVSSAGFSATTHHAASKAGAPDTVAAWLKQCDTEELQCENRLLKAPVLTSAKDSFMTADETDYYNLTPKVRDWLQAHPERNKNTINSGIAAAVTALYPCKG
jgi:hypothetical protein